MKKYLSITELGRLKNITTETLRHYDRKGLFKPEYVDPNTKYRYYSMRQCERIGTIIELRELGMSIKDIKDYLDNRCIETTTALLAQKRLEISEAVKHLKKSEKLLLSKLTHINRAAGRTDFFKPEIKYLEERKIASAYAMTDNIDEYLYNVMRLENMLSEVAPIFATSRVGSVIQKDSFLQERERFSRIAFIFIEKEDKCLKEILRTIPAGEYACIYANGVLQPGSKAVRCLKSYIAENSLEVTGDLISYNEIDISITDREAENVYVVQAPVRKKQKIVEKTS